METFFIYFILNKAQDFIFLGSRITAHMTSAMKLKDTCSL